MAWSCTEPGPTKALNHLTQYMNSIVCFIPGDEIGTPPNSWNLSQLQGRQRLVRQEEITAEVIELAAGETPSEPGLS